MLAPAAIYTLMSALHTSMTEYLTDEGFTIPERSYVTLGQIADDAEQLVISAKRIYFGSVENETLRDQKLPNFTRTVVLEIRFLMCSPAIPEGSSAPSSAELEANAEDVLPWGIAIGNALINAYKEGVFLSCHGVAVGPSVPIGPEGQLVGFTQELRCGV